MTDAQIVCLKQLRSALGALQSLITGKEHVDAGQCIENADERYEDLVFKLEDIAGQLSGKPSEFGEDIWNLLRMSSNDLRGLQSLSNSKITRAIGLVVHRLLALLASYNFNSEGHTPKKGEYRYNLKILFEDLTVDEQDGVADVIRNDTDMRGTLYSSSAVAIRRLQDDPSKSFKVMLDQAMEILRLAIVQESMGLVRLPAEKYFPEQDYALERIRQAFEEIIWIVRGATLQQWSHIIDLPIVR